MLNNIKFQRKYSLEIQTIANTVITITNPFTIEFDIIRNVLAEANTGDIKIFNLPERIRNLVYKDRYATVENRLVTLRAGYTQDDPIIFRGNIREAQSYRVNTEFITKINALDGGLDMYKAFSKTTIAKGTSKRQALNDQLSNFDNMKNLTIGEFEGTYKRGRVFFGNTFELLKLETDNKLFVDNLKLNSLNDDEVLNGGISIINTDTGLLNSPKRSNTLLVFKMIFEPRTIIGQKVELVSLTNSIFNGFYKIAGIKHIGIISDAVSGKCETELSLSIGTKVLKVVDNV